MQLENMMEMYRPMQMQRAQQRERVYTIVDLESLSAGVLYGGNSKEYDKHVRETIRGDNHAPIGEHLNYEVWLDKIGKDEGRSRLITNVHIPIQKGS